MQIKAVKNRIPIFDGLKGIAILIIIAYYFFEHIIPGGFLAVNLFLFIGGFFNFRYFYQQDQLGKKVNYLQFLFRRFDRLFFPTLAMVISTATYILLFARDYLANIRNMGLSALVFLNNYYQVFNQQSYFVQAANPSPYTHLWYVSIYGQLIVLMPILIVLTYSWHKKAHVTINILLILSALSAFLMAYLYKVDQDPTRIYYGLLTRLSSFTLGGALGLALPMRLNPKPIPKNMTRAMNLLGLFAILMAFFAIKYMFGTKPFAYRFGLTLFTLLSGLIVVAAIHPSTIWNMLFRFKLFTWLGKRSFSYYLWFYPVYLLMPKNSSLLNQSPWLNYGMQFLIIMVLAELSYQVFEKRRPSLPIGQDFKWKKMVNQFNYLRSHPHELIGIKLLTGVYVFCLVIGSIAMIIANPSKGNEATNEIQSVIEKNLEIANQSQRADNKVKVVNNIEGIDQEIKLYANGLDVTFIGDSTLAAATQRIQEAFPKAIIDPEVGRQLYKSYDIVYNLKQAGMLKPTVVTMLGSNGTFTAGQLNDYVEAIGVDKDQFYINVLVDRIWTDDANRQLNRAAQEFGNVKIIDWANYARGHDDWFSEDGVHLTDIGSHELAKFISKEIYRQR